MKPGSATRLFKAENRRTRKADRGKYFQRIWDVLRAIDDAENGMTLAELSEEFAEVSPRTLRRYLDLLCETGVLLEKDERGKPLRRAFRVNEETRRLWRMELKTDELVAILLAAQLLRREGDLASVEAIENLRKRFQGTVSDDLKEFIVQSRSALLSLPPVRKADPAVVKTLREAVARSRTLDMTYAKPGGEVVKRKIDPLALVMAGGGQYVVAHCHDHGSDVTDALPRIRALAVTGATFARPSGFSAENYFANAFGIMRGGEPAEIAIEFHDWAATFVQEHIWHASQKFEKKPGGKVDLRMKCAVTPQLVSWVLSFGSAARVTGPENLRAMVRDEAAKIVARIE